MNKVLFGLLVAVSLLACNDKKEEGKFTVEATMKNVADQQVYLEEVFFSNKAPEVLDTAEIKAGKFTLSATASEQGMYRLRFQNNGLGYVFVNDAKNIKFTADGADSTLQGPDFNSPANHAFKSFLLDLDSRKLSYITEAKKVEELQKAGATSDSALTAARANLQQIDNGFKDMVIKTLDTTSFPVVGMFIFGYTQDMDTATIAKSIASLEKRFPDHSGIKELISTYRNYQAPAPAQGSTGAQSSGGITVGNMAPNFTMNDTEGKPFTLSSLQGKYVLIDFWASWCGPCRAENPNVVAAFNKYKAKNFTILGVSLDEDKAAWMQAIKKDKLNWQHVSDLKGWENATVNMYGYSGIPYNVLLDPTGKIIATELRGPALMKKLGEVL